MSQTANFDILLVLGAFASMLAGFYVIIRFILTQASNDRESDRVERRALITAMSEMANSNLVIANETRKGNREAKERNGHLGEQTVHLAALVAEQNKNVDKIATSTCTTADILSKSALIAAEDRTILTSGQQYIAKQFVDKQVITKPE